MAAMKKPEAQFYAKYLNTVPRPEINGCCPSSIINVKKIFKGFDTADETKKQHIFAQIVFFFIIKKYKISRVIVE